MPKYLALVQQILGTEAISNDSIAMLLKMCEFETMDKLITTRSSRITTLLRESQVQPEHFQKILNTMSTGISLMKGTPFSFLDAGPDEHNKVREGRKVQHFTLSCSEALSKVSAKAYIPPPAFFTPPYATDGKKLAPADVKRLSMLVLTDMIGVVGSHPTSAQKQEISLACNAAIPDSLLPDEKSNTWGSVIWSLKNRMFGLTAADHRRNHYMFVICTPPSDESMEADIFKELRDCRLKYVSEQGFAYTWTLSDKTRAQMRDDQAANIASARQEADSLLRLMPPGEALPAGERPPTPGRNPGGETAADMDHVEDDEQEAFGGATAADMDDVENGEQEVFGVQQSTGSFVAPPAPVRSARHSEVALAAAAAAADAAARKIESERKAANRHQEELQAQRHQEQEGLTREREASKAKDAFAATRTMISNILGQKAIRNASATVAAHKAKLVVNVGTASGLVDKIPGDLMACSRENERADVSAALDMIHRAKNRMNLTVSQDMPQLEVAFKSDMTALEALQSKYTGDMPSSLTLDVIKTDQHAAKSYKAQVQSLLRGSKDIADKHAGNLKVCKDAYKSVQLYMEKHAAFFARRSRPGAVQMNSEPDTGVPAATTIEVNSEAIATVQPVISAIEAQGGDSLSSLMDATRRRSASIKQMRPRVRQEIAVLMETGIHANPALAHLHGVPMPVPVIEQPTEVSTDSALMNEAPGPDDIPYPDLDRRAASAAAGKAKARMRGRDAIRGDAVGTSAEQPLGKQSSRPSIRIDRNPRSSCNRCQRAFPNDELIRDGANWICSQSQREECDATAMKILSTQGRGARNAR